MAGEWWRTNKGDTVAKSFSKNELCRSRVWELVWSIRTLVGVILGPVLLLGLFTFPGHPAVLQGRVKGWAAFLVSAGSTVLDAIVAGGCFSLVGGYWETSVALVLYPFLLVALGWPRSVGWGAFACWWLALSAMTLGVRAGVRRVGRGLICRWPRVARALMASREALLFLVGLLNAFIWSGAFGSLADFYFVSCLEDLPPSLEQWAKLIYPFGSFVRAVFWGDEEFFLLALLALPFLLGFRFRHKAAGKFRQGWRFAVALVVAFVLWYARDVRFASWKFEGDRAHISACLIRWSGSGGEPGYYAAVFERPAAWYGLYGSTVAFAALVLLGCPFGFVKRRSLASARAGGGPFPGEGRQSETP